MEVSAISPNLVGGVDRVGPSIAERSIEAVVHLHSENTAILAFAAQPIEQRTVVGVPFLSQLPLLGTFFRTTTGSTMTSTLIATVKAVIERDEALALTAELEQHLATLDAAERNPAVAAGG